MPREEDLPLVRGRILLGAQIARHGDLKHRHVCAYCDLVPDTVENRVTLAALRTLPALLQRGLDDALIKRARALLPRFEGVQVISRAAALALLHQWMEEDTPTGGAEEDDEFFRNLDASRTSNRLLFPPELKGITW